MDNVFPNEHVYSNELYPLKEVKFEDTTIMVPKIQKNVLFRTYSKQCLTACKISKHTELHEMSSKKMMELRFRIIKNIYNFENTLCVPRNIMFTSLQYKLLKKLEKIMNIDDKKNILFNKIILQTCKKIDNLTNLL
jgi:hypothetical protein